MSAPLLPGPMFAMACEQFDHAADLLGLAADFRDRLKYPKRCISVTFPVRMDSGETRIFVGHRVQHHLTLGPTKGGLRFSPDVDIGEVAALAMWMSWKTALIGLPYGGAKGGVACDPRNLSLRELETVTRRYTQEMIPFIGPEIDVMAPDMGTNEQVMAWMYDTYSMHAGQSVPEIVTGKPVILGGSQGRKESTGKGVSFLVNRALDFLKIDSASATAVIHGFGNVGAVAAQSLARHGTRIVGIADISGGIANPKGIPIDDALDHMRAHGSLEGFAGGDRIPADAVLELPCDVLIPAATAQVIHGGNAAKIRCRVLAEGANGPTTPEADRILAARDDLFIIPDVLCNAGGVIVSYFEWVQDLQNFFWSETEVFDHLYRMLETAFSSVTKRAKERGISHRDAALGLGIERVAEAKRLRGIFP